MLTPIPKHLELDENLKPPNSALFDNLPTLPRGMKAWRNANNGYTVCAIHFSADPSKDSLEWFKAETKTLRDDQIKREYLLDAASRSGQKAFPYLEMKPHKWLRETKYPIPKNHTIIAGLDFGGTNPTAITFYQIDERARFHAFWEFYKPSSPGEIARVLKNHPLWDRVQKVVADPSIFNKNQHNKDRPDLITSIGDQLEMLGIYNLERGVNDRIAGFQRVKHMLRYSEFNADLNPWLTFAPECVNLWRELTGLVFKEQSPEDLLNKNLDEDVVKKNDHAYDQMRYALMSWKVPSEFEEKPPPDELSFRAIEDEIGEKYRMEEDGDF